MFLQAELERLCESERMNCFRHDNEHWRTAPLWTAGPFCFCMSASNNTYNCVRTINATHNLLYCEFVTGLVTYYNLRIGKSGTKYQIKRKHFVTILKIKPIFNFQIHSRHKTEWNIWQQQKKIISTTNYNNFWAAAGHLAGDFHIQTRLVHITWARINTLQEYPLVYNFEYAFFCFRQQRRSYKQTFWRRSRAQRRIGWI